MTSDAIVDKNDNQWLLDTGCNNHLSGKKELFSDLDESFQTTVKLSDNSTCSPGKRKDRHQIEG